MPKFKPKEEFKTKISINLLEQLFEIGQQNLSLEEIIKEAFSTFPIVQEDQSYKIKFYPDGFPICENLCHFLEEIKDEISIIPHFPNRGIKLLSGKAISRAVSKGSLGPTHFFDGWTRVFFYVEIQGEKIGIPFCRRKSNLKKVSVGNKQGTIASAIGSLPAPYSSNSDLNEESQDKETKKRKKGNKRKKKKKMKIFKQINSMDCFRTIF